MVKTYSLKKDGNTKLSPHFKVKEFKCKDGTDKVLIESGLVDTLEELYDVLGCKSITITSGYRTPSHDKKVGGKGSGNHVEGKAADFRCYAQDGKAISSKAVVLALEDMGALGIAYRCGGSPTATHLDVNYRTTKWFGDEKISMSKAIWNIKSGCRSFYDYLGVKKKSGKECVVVVKSLNYREGPSTSYRVAGVYYKNAKLTITDESDGWGFTGLGWVKMEYLKEM